MRIGVGLGITHTPLASAVAGQIVMSTGFTGRFTAGTVLTFYCDGGIWKEIYRSAPHSTQIALADDEAVVLPLPKNSGHISISATPSLAAQAVFAYRANSGTEGVTSISTGAVTSLGTTALTTGTGDGVDARLNVHVNAGNLYIKNRLGGSISVNFKVLS